MFAGHEHEDHAKQSNITGLICMQATNVFVELFLGNFQTNMSYQVHRIDDG